MAANTKFDICSQALAMIGVAAITSFDDGTTESTVAGQLYEVTLEDRLCGHRWRFASVQETLVPLASAPEGRWDRAYALPADCLVVHGLTLAGRPVEYDRYENMVYCDLGADDEPVVDYTYRPDESLFPSYFTAAFRFELASLFAAGITRNAELEQRFDTRAVRAYGQARLIDSQQQTARRVRATRLLTFR